MYQVGRISSQSEPAGLLLYQGRVLTPQNSDWRTFNFDGQVHWPKTNNALLEPTNEFV